MSTIAPVTNEGGEIAASAQEVQLPPLNYPHETLAADRFIGTDPNLADALTAIVLCRAAKLSNVESVVIKKITELKLSLTPGHPLTPVIDFLEQQIRIHLTAKSDGYALIQLEKKIDEANHVLESPPATGVFLPGEIDILLAPRASNRNREYNNLLLTTDPSVGKADTWYFLSQYFQSFEISTRQDPFTIFVYQRILSYIDHPHPHARIMLLGMVESVFTPPLRWANAKSTAEAKNILDRGINDPSLEVASEAWVIYFKIYEALLPQDIPSFISFFTRRLKHETPGVYFFQYFSSLLKNINNQQLVRHLLFVMMSNKDTRDIALTDEFNVEPNTLAGTDKIQGMASLATSLSQYILNPKSIGHYSGQSIPNEMYQFRILEVAYNQLSVEEKKTLRELCCHCNDAFVFSLLSRKAEDGIFPPPDSKLFRFSIEANTNVSSGKNPCKDTSPLVLILSLYLQNLNSEDASAVWQEMGLQTIQFKDAGQGFSTIPLLMKTYLHSLPDPIPVDMSSINKIETDFIEKVALLNQYNATGEPQKKGRSHLYEITDDPHRFLVLKYRLDGESSKTMTRELNWFELIRKIPGIQSELPEAMMHENQAVKWTLHYGGEVIAFKAPKNYYKYLDELGLSAEDDSQFFSGLKKSVHDIFLLSRYGIYHTAPIAAFHNTEARYLIRSDAGRFVTMPDIVFEDSHMLGMGHFDNWPKAIKHANMGVSGMRDFAELATLQEIMEVHGQWMPQLNNLKGRPNAAVLYDAAILQQALVGATLFVGNRLVQKAKAAGKNLTAWQDDEFLKPFAEMLHTLFSEAHAAKYDIPLDAAKLLMTPMSDWQRLARQLAFFMTPAYVPFVLPGSKAKNFPTKLIYGDGVVVSNFNIEWPETFHKTFGWVGANGKTDELSLGSTNGQFPIREMEKAMFAVFIQQKFPKQKILNHDGISEKPQSNIIARRTVRSAGHARLAVLRGTRSVMYRSGTFRQAVVR